MFLLKNCSHGKELSNDVLIFRFNENFGLFYWNGLLKRIQCRGFGVGGMGYLRRLLGEGGGLREFVSPSGDVVLHNTPRVVVQ